MASDCALNNLEVTAFNVYSIPLHLSNVGSSTKGLGDP